MTPRVDDFGNLSSTDDDDDDDGFMEDMAALSRACRIVGANDNSAAEDGVPSEDPLIDTSTAIVSVATDSDSDGQDDLECLKRVQSLYQPLSVLPPLAPLALSDDDDDDDEDDLETVRAIMRRFGDYNEGLREDGKKVLVEGDQTSSMGCEGEVANGSTHKESDGGELYPVSQDPNEAATEELIENIEMQLSDFVESSEPDAGESSRLPHKRLSCPPVVQCFIDAIKKNRDLQRFLRGKLIELEAKIEENKKIRNRIKILKDFQASCNRRTGNVLSLKKDPRVQLISAKKSSASKKSKKKKKVPAMCYGPEENSHAANYRMVLERFPLSLDRKKWSKVERENLLKGIKQQFQEMVLQLSLSIDRTSSEELLREADDMDNIIASVKDLEVTPERIRKFLPKVNWDLISSMYVGGRTGTECESRWLNYEDPLINQGAWTKEEDKSLLLIVQDTGIRNWFEIAASLGTSRTPFQCLSRFQRSLNPSMLNSEWTEEEDAQLYSAVTYFGDGNWQYVASVLERRTGTQCSNRWKKSLCPEKKGSFTQEEDIRLTVAVMLFGRKWNQIAKYVPGRIQSQCRDRYLNSLDPSLKWGGWTEEEDLRLEAAIAKHGYCWSKIAEEVPPRTDSQCRKRWKVLCPEQVPLLQEARKKQRSIISCNFVDRESERPTITLDDFMPLIALAPKSDIGASKLPKKRKSSNVSKKTSSKKRAKRTRRCAKEVQDTEVYNDDEFYAESECSNLPKKNTRSKRHTKRSQNCPQELVDISCSDKVEICIEGSENQSTCIANSENEDWDSITLSSFIRNKSNEILSRFTKNLSHTSFSSRITDVPEQAESQNPSDDQSGLSQSCDTVGTINLFVPPNTASDRRVRNREDTNTLAGDDDDDHMTLASFLGNKPKKECQPKGHHLSSSKLKTGSVLLNEEHCAGKPTNISDDSGSMSKHVEEMETVLHGCVDKSMDIIVEEKDDELFASPVQNRPRRERKRPSRFL
ncbi:myb proto-oncogene protein [Vigna unguiculata]|uniref:Myb proto-oncogene protein n=2 Tax=Vigna unguiculata TaxID=3917 RepID=A0A4D6LKJ9_VIGUN|nr:myb proto-oncogene protein [Vigna unguiculata]